MSHPDPIRWFEWGTDAFLSAAKEQKPVLLSIGAAWCRWTEEMDRISYRDPRVLQLVTERFVAIRVDADRRPDVSERYTLGGWPTTAFLTPDGDILGGGTYLDPGQLTKVLEQVADAFAIRRPEVDARAAEFRAGGTEASGTTPRRSGGPDSRAGFAGGSRPLAAAVFGCFRLQYAGRQPACRCERQSALGRTGRGDCDPHRRNKKPQ